MSGGTEPWTRERSLADDTIQSQAGSALSRKASLHFKTRCSHDQGDDLGTRDGVFGGKLAKAGVDSDGWMDGLATATGFMSAYSKYAVAVSLEHYCKMKFLTVPAVPTYRA